MNKFWNKPCYEFNIKQSIDAGYLCPFKVYGSSVAFDLSSVKNAKRDYTENELKKIISSTKHVLQVREFVEICNKSERKKVIILCSNIEHAETIRLEVEKYEECMIAHSKMKKANDLIEEYKKNDIRMMVSIGMMSEGFDCAKCDCVVFLRPTRSAKLMVQASGRGLRIFDGKDYCLFLDYGSVFMNCGLPTEPILNFEKKSETETSQVICCESCFYIYDIKGPCPSCGHEKEPEKREVDKNLLESIDRPNPFVIVDKSVHSKFGKTSRGAKYITITTEKGSFTFFAWQSKRFLSLISRGEVKITYMWQPGKRFPKVLGIEPHRPNE